MDIPALIARFRLLGGPEGAAAARALLASINSTMDVRQRTPLDQIRSLEAIAANDVSRYAVVGGAGPRHWEQEPRDQTGKWTSGGGGASPKAKQEHPGKFHAQEIHTTLDQPPEKAAAGLVGLLKKSATKAGEWLHALESLAHAALDFIKGRLPAPVVKPVEKAVGAMFATYTAGQSVVERVAKGQGLDEAAVKKRVKWCQAVDLAGAKLLSVAGAAAGGAVGGTAASLLPLGSTAYVIGSLFASPQVTSEALVDSLMENVPEEVGAGMYGKAGWNEADHPRGQPENAGQFVEKASAAVSKVRESAQAHKRRANEAAESLRKTYRSADQMYGPSGASVKTRQANESLKAEGVPYSISVHETYDAATKARGLVFDVKRTDAVDSEDLDSRREAVKWNEQAARDGIPFRVRIGEDGEVFGHEVDEAAAAEEYKRLGTKARAFKDWFGDWEKSPEASSKVVDANGEPQETHGFAKVVYHGSTATFDRFDASKAKAEGLYGAGLYFTENETVAREYQVSMGGTFHFKPKAIAEIRKGIEHLTDRPGLVFRDEEDGGFSVTEADGDGKSLFRVGPKTDISKLRIGALVRNPKEKEAEIDRIKTQSYELAEEPEGSSRAACYLNIRRPFDVDKDRISAKQIGLIGAQFAIRSMQNAMSTIRDDRPSAETEIAPGLDPEEHPFHIDEWIAYGRETGNFGIVDDDGEKVANVPEDIRKRIQAMGYDGITHMGGTRMGRGVSHRVWIAFEETQAKAVDNVGTFEPLDPRLRYAKAEHDPYAEEALALADLHAGLFNSYLDCGLGISAEEIERAQAELADVGGRIEYADGQWHAFADDAPGGVKMYGRWHWAGEEQDEPLRFAASEWVAEKSTKSKNPSGNRYRNTRTGQIRYFKKPPATREQRQEEFRSKGDVDREKLKGRTQGHVQTDDAAVKKQAANAFRALFYHHGDFAVHRLQELADDTEMALGKAQEGTPAHDALKRKMAALDAMLSHADERGITGKVPPKMVAEQAAAEPWAGKGEPELGKVYNAPTEALNIDPKRFQFKLKTDASGVTQELKAVQTWNPDFAGTLAVWKDPEDGKTYVVNGHHRRELAGRLNVEDMAVRYIDAKTPEEARAKGALINIAEGRGTPVDAAKFMRDTGTGPGEMAKTGVSLKGKLAEDAVALTALSDKLFDRVARDDMEIGRALAIGRNLPDHARQEKLVKILDKREDEGKDISLRTVEEMAKEMAAVPAVTRNDAAEGMGLFGNEDYEDDVFVERNELKGYIRNQLAQDVNDFAVVASKRRADKVAGAGNTLDVEKNKATSEEADRVRNTFDGLVNLKGPVSSALNDAAKEYAAAKGRKAKDAAKQRALEAVRAAVASESGAGQQNGLDKPSPVAQGGDGAGASDAAGPAAAADDAGRGNSGESGLNPSIRLAEQGKVSDNSSGGEGPPKENENGRQDHDPGRVSEREAVSADDANGVRGVEPQRPADDRRDELRRRDGSDRGGRDSDGGRTGETGRVGGEAPVRSGSAEAVAGAGEGRQPGQAGQQQVAAEPVFTAKQRVREHLGKGDADRNPAYRDALDKLHTSLSANGLTTPDLVEPFMAARNKNDRAAAARVAAKKWGVDVQSAEHVLAMAATKQFRAKSQEAKEPADLKEAPKADPSTTAFFKPAPVQGNLLNDNGGEWVKPLTSGEKAKPLYTPNSSESTRTKEEIDGKSAIQRSMEEKERAAEAASPAPSAQRHDEIAAQLRAMRSSPQWGTEEMHNQAVDLERELEHHKPAAVARAQQEIDAPRGAASKITSMDKEHQQSNASSASIRQQVEKEFGNLKHADLLNAMTTAGVKFDPRDSRSKLLDRLWRHVAAPARAREEVAV